ncbi:MULTISPECIES: hypothetical protein [unclassified Leifsonia]|uniref:hypothetical protein n=1 Tax=unclassified Leifsonia TaxID=2663824 RepID=UPI0008A747B4|nr:MULTISPECIES: hypothetical protein [unclassified Leifsonia]SEI09973.1 hypothetical protein SAMN04515694_11537 [Leifsonia sp. CL154]SFL86988.1 hypothetical protein SAMN04515692_11571 [Leifsonia sp. CL147]
MDEYFDQPVPHGRMVEPHRTRTRDAIDAILAGLNDDGLHVVVHHAQYGWV